MLKLKQANNPKFAFLLVDNELHSYYKAKVAQFEESATVVEEKKLKETEKADTSAPPSSSLPPATIKLIIDRVAKHAASLSDEAKATFFDQMREGKRDDEQFAFFNKDHVHHEYFQKAVEEEKRRKAESWI
eukprot:TRINITY_DN5219_c0_g2_i1.p1 TRINITY_DN5219_c0_g2~~TRINITY_DN5219_c0_g2_i1.p1  ORF type:complete len:131 (-),score=35.69 TRINITY_DN5219_c0_g2_i1:25-417(-)